jgi:alpha-mannosidase II
MAEIFYSLAVARGAGLDTGDKYRNYLTLSRRALGLFQHHDGITGTAKEHVVNDYATK